MKGIIDRISLHIKKIGFVSTCSYLFQRISLKKDDLIKLRVPSIKNPIYLRNKSYDTHIFYQIFIKEDLGFIKSISHPITNIIDAGANIGLSTIYLKGKFPNASIISIEPSQINFEILKKNTAGYAGITLQHCALLGTEQMVSISNPDDNYAAFKVSQNDNLNNIKAYPLSYFLKSDGFENIDLVKVDIEGSEMDVFSKIDDNTLSKISAFAIEIHENMVPGSTEIINRKLSSYNLVFKHGEYDCFIKNIL